MWSLEILKRLNEEAVSKAKEDKPKQENPNPIKMPPITGQKCPCGEKGCVNNG